MVILVTGTEGPLDGRGVLSSASAKLHCIGVLTLATLSQIMLACEIRVTALYLVTHRRFEFLVLMLSSSKSCRNY